MLEDLTPAQIQEAVDRAYEDVCIYQILMDIAAERNEDWLPDLLTEELKWKSEKLLAETGVLGYKPTEGIKGADRERYWAAGQRDRLAGRPKAATRTSALGA